jgi:hypothetical protein
MASVFEAQSENTTQAKLTDSELEKRVSEAIAARAEYLADMGGLFSGATQYLKEGTFTFDYRQGAW